MTGKHGWNRRSILWGSLASGGTLVADAALARAPESSSSGPDEVAGRVNLLDLIPKDLHAGIRSGSIKEPVRKYFIDAFTRGGTFYAPSGLYLIDGMLPTAGVSLVGDGIGRTIFRNSDPSNEFDLMRCENGSADLSSFTLDNVIGDDKKRGSGLVLSHATNCRLIDIACLEMNTQGFAMRDNCTLNKLHGLRAYRCRHRGMNISENSNDNIIYDFHAIDCFKAGFLIGFGSHRNLISKLRLFGSQNGCFWLHHGCEQNVISDVIAGGTAADGPPNRPIFRVEIACRDNDFSNLLLTGSRRRALQVVNAPVVNQKLAAKFGFGNSPCERNSFRGVKIFGETPDDADSVGLLVANSSTGNELRDNEFEDFYISGFGRGVAFNRSAPSGTRFSNFSFGKITGKKWDIGFEKSLGTRLNNAEGLSFAGSLEDPSTNFGIAHPGFAADKEIINPFGLAVMIVVSGAVGGTPHIDGVPVGDPAPNEGNGSWILGPGQKFKFAGGGAKTRWKWFALN